jgi:hypothetical protein
MKTAITFACDSNYFPLLKGTVLSLEALGIVGDEISLHLADIGCSPEDLAWAAEHRINVVPFRVADHYNFGADAPDNQRYAGLLYRGVIPRLFPGHDVYVHIDADIWIQTTAGVMDYINIAAAMPDKAVVTPCRHYSYMSEYRDDPGNRQAMYRGYANLYGADVANVFCTRPVISAGMVAAHRSHRIWTQWRDHLEVNYSKRPVVDADQGGAEQMTLNYLLQTDLDFVPLEGSFNYNCHVGFPLRLKGNGLVSVGFPPYPTINVIHLTCFSLFKAMYFKYGLLYDSGNYLTPEDMRKLGLS